ncbi:hypothetical protein Goari_017394 [Gossypium aridum]|uniref:NB-ARC domain-containing protein n=1 Tax=Gossypium aridum TaxID=34290 RepID=A0A7J8WMJ1_GOSAI|nr:hypothetical protein [Gossypium aridum]
MELVGPIFDVLNCLRDPTCTYIDQHRNLEERMNDLQARVDQLNATKRDVGLRIKEEVRCGRLLREEVEKWILAVQTINDTIRDINERSQNVSCFSRETTVKSDIWNYLMSDEIGMIGVCGMGGIGKTTIMKHIYNQLSKEIKPLFDVIIWVTVSKELNITKLQQDMANAMNIGALPEVEPKRVSVLMEELRRRKYVLILDEVWKSSLWRKSMNCKIVKVHPLSNEESMNLFLVHTEHGVLKVPFLEQILGHIVRKCTGLPLAIAVIAGSMKGIYDVADWRNALRELRDHVRSGVKMHDVMRNTALYIKRFGPRFMVKAGIGLKELPSTQEWKEDFERVSFMMNKVSDIPPSLSPNCENLLTLLLQNNKSLGRISESFFQHMHSLSILDLSYTNIQQLPNSVSILEKLNALVLHGCEMLRYLPSLEKLKALRKLDLHDTAEAKFDVNERRQLLEYDGCRVEAPEVMKAVVADKGVESESFDLEKVLVKGIGVWETVEFKLRQHGYYGVISKAESSQFPVLLPKKEVILSGCHIQIEDPVVLPTDLRVLRISKCHNVLEQWQQQQGAKHEKQQAKMKAKNKK